MNNEKLEQFSIRLKSLDDDEWCPYPSELFIETCIKVDDNLFMKLVNERRTYTAPYFFGNDPMHEKLLKIRKGLIV